MMYNAKKNLETTYGSALEYNKKNKNNVGVSILYQCMHIFNDLFLFFCIFLSL